MIYSPKEFCQSLIRDALKIETTFEHLPKSCAACITNGYHKEMTDRDGKPFTSFKQFCEYTLPHGMELRWDVLMKISERTPYREIIMAQEVLDEPLAEQGRPEGENKLRNTDYVRPPDTAAYILRRLARDGAEDASKAELFKQVTKGTISAHKAALEAGYRTKKTPLEQAKMIITKLTWDDMEAVLEFLASRLKSVPR